MTHNNNQIELRIARAEARLQDSLPASEAGAAFFAAHSEANALPKGTAKAAYREKLAEALESRVPAAPPAPFV